MNPMKDSVAIMDDIMNYVIQDAEEELNGCLEALDGIIPSKQIEDLRSAAWGLSNATDYPAILYGMRVAQAIQDVTANPAPLSQCILDRVANNRDSRH